MTASEKLKKLLFYFDTNKNRLGTLINKRQSLYDIENGKIKSFSIELVSEIKKVYPEINERFFLFDDPHMTISKNMSNDDFLSHIPEAAKKENGTKKEVMDALQKITAKKSDGKPKNFNEGSLVKLDDLVPQKVIEIPIKGFAGLKQAFYADDYIQEHFKETVEYVRPEEKIIGVYYKTKIEKNNFSMAPTLNPGETTWNEPISEMFWNNENIFKKDKVYSLWHPYRGILFKRITKHNIEKGIITLSSDNEDKETYEDEDFSLSEFRKILIVRKKEVLM